MNHIETPTMAPLSMCVPELSQPTEQSRPLWQRVGAGVALASAFATGGMARDIVLAEPAAAVAPSHDNPTLEGVADITHQLEHIRSGKKPNFKEVRACTKPEVSTSPTDVQTLAQFCVTYGMHGPDGKGSDVAIVDMTSKSTKSLRSIGNAAEKEMAQATDGVITLDTRVIKPSKKATNSVKRALKLNGGCVAPSLYGGMVSDLLRDNMPSLKKYPNVIAVTDKTNCITDAMAFSAVGLADTRSNVDILGARDYSKSEIKDAMVHEIGHNLGLDHFGTYMPFMAESYAHNMDIPVQYIKNGQFKISRYQEDSEYTTYDGGCSNIMGSVCYKADYVDGKEPAFNTFQKDALQWALEATGVQRDSGLRKITEQSHTFEPNNAQSGSTAHITVEQPIGTNRTDYRGRYVAFDVLLATPNRVQIPGTNMYKYDGARLELANSATTAIAALGNLKLKAGDSVDVVVPGYMQQTITISMTKNGNITVSSQFPDNVNEGEWK